MPTFKLFNTKTQSVEHAEMTVDANNEIVATFEDGGIIKFPAGLSKTEFEELIEQHQVANEGQEIITPEMEAAAALARQSSLDLIGETSSPEEGDKTDDAPNEALESTS